jgi:hypothetical protein
MTVILYNKLVDYQVVEVKEVIEGAREKIEKWCHGQHIEMKTQVDRLGKHAQILEGHDENYDEDY